MDKMIWQEINKRITFQHSLLNGISHAWLNKIHTVLNFLPSDLTGKRVIDIACGEGYFSALCAARGASVTALDIDSHALEATKDLCEKCGVCCTHYIQSDVESFIRGDVEEYDYALCLDIIEHIDNPTLILREIIKRSNYVILCLPNGLYFSHILSEPSMSMGHKWFFTRKSGESLINSAGGMVGRTNDWSYTTPHLIYEVKKNHTSWKISEDSVRHSFAILQFIPILIIQAAKWFFYDKRMSMVKFAELVKKPHFTHLVGNEWAYQQVIRTNEVRNMIDLGKYCVVWTIISLAVCLIIISLIIVIIRGLL